MPVRRARRALGPNLLPVVVIVVSVTAMLTYGYVAFAAGPGPQPLAVAGPAPATPITTSTTPTTTTSSTSTTTTSTTTTVPLPPPPPEPPGDVRYVVPETEVEPEVKQLAADIAYWLTTYEASEDPMVRLGALSSLTGVEQLAEAAGPLAYPGSWSRGEVIYPQLGGLTDERASVMVVTRQTVGSGAAEDFAVVRTLDIRLVRNSLGVWGFDYLSSAGGIFESVEDLALAHAVARDPRIEMSDSARLDIRAGRVAPELLRLMAQIAERTPYGVAVLATGHPHNVFETDRQSHHSVGRAIDIYRVGDSLVIDDRTPDSRTRLLVQWLFDHPDVHQVGSPWDLDDEASMYSFTNTVHQDHIHVAVSIPVPEVQAEEEAGG
ncbi:MAG TPA: hypothetical protein VK960_10105 [Acidimicrobiia bacterium]|nr:hypothetical protein [Acidimicrobiia bacterium]